METSELKITYGAPLTKEELNYDDDNCEVIELKENDANH